MSSLLPLLYIHGTLELDLYKKYNSKQVLFRNKNMRDYTLTKMLIYQ